MCNCLTCIIQGEINEIQLPHKSATGCQIQQIDESSRTCL